MKKALLLAATTTAICTGTAFAGAEDMFYVKAGFAANMLKSQTNKPTKLEAKSKTGFNFDLGVGYYVMDNVRAELSFTHYMNPELKKTGTAKGDYAGEKVTAKHKGDINALMVNGYVDMFDVSIAKVFAGAGVGMAQISEKVSVAGDGFTDSVKAKKKSNFAYSVALGASTEFAPGINGELAYSWKDFGKTKSAKDVDGDQFGETAYKGHHFTVGVRFDI